MHLLKIDGLEARIGEGTNERILLKDISFGVSPGEFIAIIGESGAGKTTLLRAITDLFPRGAGIRIGGKVLFQGKNLLKEIDHEAQQIRYDSRIRYVFQEPSMAFNPVLRIRPQVEYLLGKDQFREDAFSSCLDKLGIEHPLRTLQQYPHQLSVGILQRISIALALSGSPALILADEPLSAIDAIHRNRIVSILLEQCSSRGIALLFATHDLDAARLHAQTTFVLYKGRIVEKSTSMELFSDPRHPYSKALLSHSRDYNLEEDRRGQADRRTSGAGCVYYSRCSIALPSCREQEPEVVTLTKDHEVRCPCSR